MDSSTKLFYVTILLTYLANEIVSFSENNVTFYRRPKRQISTGKCRRDQFSCNSGECVDRFAECDGVAHCTDKSDETDECQKLKCPPFTFICDYGACIDGNLKCDGKPDCVDKSDESPSICSEKTETKKCPNNQFRCLSGQCIREDQKCDGTYDCLDQSDEIVSTCWNINCPGFLHRCSYGACVDGDAAECDGVKNCADGSDEEPSKCGKKNDTISTPSRIPIDPVPLPILSGSCRLPNHPEHGQWQTVPVANFQPGHYVNPGKALKILCNPTYTLQGVETITCDKGKWSNPIGQCVKSCPDLVSTNVLTATCYFNNIPKENCLSATENTVAKYQCANYYEEKSLKYIDVCRDGTWDRNRPKCVPECGRRQEKPTLLIVGGKNVTRGNFPWHVALYKKHQNNSACGGSLISQQLIITAAHCLTDIETADLYPKEDFEVAVGKYFVNRYDDRDEKDAQFSSIKEIVIHPRYKALQQNYVGDIALIVTSKKFELSHRVQPVCMDWGQIFASELSNPQTLGNGYVSGWGFTEENDKQSEVLKELQLPLVSIESCTAGISEVFQQYLTEDKICAGFFDKSTSVCQGDSGGGLVFKFDGRYYLTGIVSLSPRAPQGGCDSQSVGLFTRMYSYMDFFYSKAYNYGDL